MQLTCRYDEYEALFIESFVMYCAPKYDSITTGLRDVLHWLPVQQRTEYKVSLLIYKCLHQAAPLYLTEMCVPVSATQQRHGLRSAARGDLEVPRCNLARYGQPSFYVSGPSLWNSLPLTVRDSSLTLTQFCTRLKTFCLLELTGHHHSASATASAVRIAART